MVFAIPVPVAEDTVACIGAVISGVCGVAVGAAAISVADA